MSTKTVGISPVTITLEYSDGDVSGLDEATLVLDWWTGSSVTGGKTISASAPLEVLPLYLAEGGIVPLLRPTIDSMSPTTKPGTAAGEVDSYATTPGVLWARVAPGPATSFLLFDGSELSQDDKGSELSLGYRDGSEFTQGAVFEILGFGAAPKSVSDGGSALAMAADLSALEAVPSGWAFSSENGGTLWVKVAAGTHAATVTR